MGDDSAPLLDVVRVRAALDGTRFADVRYVAETASTNDDAAPLLGDPAAAGATLVAEYQSAGRGRTAGRSWLAPPGSALLFTAILPDALPTASLWAIPFWSALAVADGVEAGCGIRLDLRWPNDLDLGGRKVCGILGTSRVYGERAFAACGIGLNVRRPAHVPPEIEPPPAYLSDAGPGVEREAVLAGILAAMDALLPALEDPLLTRAWEERAALHGRRYRLRLDADGSIVEGNAVRLAPEGGLVISSGGAERTIHLADARVLP